jgi:hypothetical protein
MVPNLLVLFAPRFLLWPIAALHNLRRDAQDLRVQGIVTGGAKIVRSVKESGLVDAVIDVVAQEHEWLASEGAEAEISQWERRLQPGALSRILLSDRHLSHWTVEAVTAATPLKRAARDPRLVNRYLVGLLKAVDDLVELQGVNAMFTYAVAGAPAMVMAELANSRGVPFFALNDTRIDNQQTFDNGNDALEGHGSLVALYRTALKDGRAVAGGLERARNYLESFRAAPVEPGYQSNQKRQLEADLSLRTITIATRGLPRAIRRMTSTSAARNLRKPNALGDWFIRASRPLRARIAQRYFETPAIEALQGRFAYYPLHVDPEASTMVLAPMFSNQGQVIEAIVKALPPDMTLLVKEHPTMHGLRPIAFYRRLRRLPRVRLISPTVSSFNLIRHCDLTCSITGTAAWEAMLLRKPALVLGAFLFSAVGKGLVTCRDFARLPEAVGQALRQEPADDHSLLTFLAAVYSTCFGFPPDLQWTKVTPKMLADNSAISEAMASQILQRLREAGVMQPMRLGVGVAMACHQP